MRKQSLQGKAMTLVLAAALAACGLPVVHAKADESSVNAADEYEAVRKVSDVEDYGADTAATSVITIKDVTDWNTFATQCSGSNNYFSGVTVKLANDIDFLGVSNDNFKQLSDFKGTFDGCGHTISGLVATSYCGLFDDLNGTVKNVTISDSKFAVSAKIFTGVIANYNYGVIDNCHIKNTTIKNTDLKSRIGGIAGRMVLYGEIKNCTVYADSKVEGGEFAGGICGDVTGKGNIKNCANMGAVSGEYAGGIAGNSEGIENCYNTGKVTGTAYAAGIVYEASGVIWNCYYSSESAALPYIKNSNVVEQPTHLSAAEMQQQSFCDTLNKNRGTNTDWLEWEKTINSVYPTIKAVKSISECNVALAADKLTYTGKEQTPVVAVTDGSYSLVPETDFTVTYADNKDIGTASVRIEGTGRYCDSIVKTFTIVKDTPTYSYSKLGTKTYGAPAASLNVKANKGDLGTITFSSSNSKVASVNGNGYVYFNAPGTATITVKCSGTDYYEPVSFTVPVKVLPAKPVVKLSSKKKKITIKYGKVVGASGYEIQYSLKKNFKSGVKTFKITKTKKVTSKLKKGKKYYVRVRAYTNSGGQVLNSAWSSKKNIKVKK